jgi:hypothetical protein
MDHMDHMANMAHSRQPTWTMSLSCCKEMMVLSARSSFSSSMSRACLGWLPQKLRRDRWTGLQPYGMLVYLR